MTRNRSEVSVVSLWKIATNPISAASSGRGRDQQVLAVQLNDSSEVIFSNAAIQTSSERLPWAMG
jgi:hypothetical protein